MVLLLAPAREGEFLGFAVERYLADKGNVECLQVLARAHRGVGNLYEDNDAGRHKQSDEQRHHYHVAVDGRGGAATGMGRLHDLGVVGGERLRHLVFLTLLQEEGVERLLHLLLALLGDEELSLLGVGGNLGVGSSLVALRTCLLCLQKCNLVVEGMDDGVTHDVETCVEVHHDRVLLRGVGDILVALEQHLVVLADL